jgi:hypothetical protein
MARKRGGLRTSVYQICCKPSILLSVTLDTNSDWLLVCTNAFRVSFLKNPKAVRGGPASNSRHERSTLETACPQAVRCIYEMPARRIRLSIAAPLSRDENDVNTNHDSDLGLCSRRDYLGGVGRGAGVGRGLGVRVILGVAVGVGVPVAVGVGVGVAPWTYLTVA